MHQRGISLTAQNKLKNTKAWFYICQAFSIALFYNLRKYVKSMHHPFLSGVRMIRLLFSCSKGHIKTAWLQAVMT